MSPANHHPKKGRARIPENSLSTDPLDQVDGLTVREAAFVHQLLKCDHGPLAAIKAGFAPSTARNVSEKLLSRPQIQSALTARRQALAIEVGVTAQDVLNELKKIGFANLEDYTTITPDGAPIIDMSTTTRAQMAALAEATTETYREGKGKNAVQVKKAKIKLHDKQAALVSLGKHLGLFKEQMEHTGPNGGPINQRWVVELVPCPTPNQPPPSLIQ